MRDIPPGIPGDLDQRLPQPVVRAWVLHRTAADGTEETVCGGCQGDQEHVPAIAEPEPAVRFVTFKELMEMSGLEFEDLVQASHARLPTVAA